MRTLAAFTRTTRIGGLLIILAIHVALLPQANAVHGRLSLLAPMAGSIFILPRARVHPVDIPFTKAIGVFSKMGH